ncbi:MAG: alpha/beta hydrolase [Rhizobiales bacterium]|nr:alpha/beta hydrolase [Hyphomicrobiales bacterium]
MMESSAPIPGTVQFDLAPQDGGPAYRIFLRIPAGEPPPAGWPVLYLLDANAVIGTAVDALRVQSGYPLGTGISKAAIVGIGYPTDEAYDSVRRSWDMGPPPGKTYPPHTPDGPDVRTGGADHFLRFIEDELKPEIARRLPVDPAQQAIFGHSFGGLFVLHALFSRPDAFTDWIAASPAIWWEDAGVLATGRRFAAAWQGRLSPRVLVLAGEFEQRLAPFQVGAADAEDRSRNHAESRIVDNARDMASWLAGLPGLHAAFELFPDETHMSVLPAAINRAIRFALGPEAHRAAEQRRR